jgi:hypothetical protein
MNDYDKAQFERWKVWRAKVFMACRRRRNVPGCPACDKEMKELPEGACSMELCPRRDEK